MAIPTIEEAQASTRFWTKKLKRKILERSGIDLYFFLRAVLWYHDIAPNHKPLCDSLDGRGDWGDDWVRAGIVAHRGWLKSSIIRGWACRNGLHTKNWSARYFGSSLDNASEHFLRPLRLAFQEDIGAEWRLWLYEDRIPKNFAGWTEDTVAFVQTDAKVPPSLSIRGITSRREGYHGHAVIGDDLEGSEAEKKTHDQVSAMEFISSATPLLIDPGKHRVLISGTVHGDDPVVYRILHEDFNPKNPPPTGTPVLDNSKRIWKIFWQPLYNGDGTPNWPQRFNEKTIAVLRKDNADSFAKNYLLRRGAPGGTLWRRKKIERFLAKWKDRDAVIYPYAMVDIEKYKKTNEVEINWEMHEARLDEMLFTGHFDPKHKEVTDNYKRARVRPSKAAIVVVGTTADGHHIAIDSWSDEVDIDKQINKLYEFHAKWGFRVLTIDPIGAQTWVNNMLKNEEKYNISRRRLKGTSRLTMGRQLVGLSAILHEDKRSPRMMKEDHIFARLDSFVSQGQMHFMESQVDLIEQAVGFPDEADYIDLLDALAQGATTNERGVLIWQSPIGRTENERHRAEQKILRNRGLQITHYRNPLKPQSQRRQETIHPALRGRMVLPKS